MRRRLLAILLVLSARLLVGGAYPAPYVVSTITTTSAGDGWTSIGGPRAVTYGTRTYIGSDNNAGDVVVRIWNGTTVSTSIVKAALEAHDLHDAPSLWVRDSDHRLVAAYSKHDGPTMYVRISTNTLDSDPTIAGGWGAEQDLDTTLGGTLYTYPQLVQLTGEVNDPLYLFYRDHEGLTGIVTFTKSTNGGASWSAQTQLVKLLDRPIYWAIHTDGLGRIDFALSMGHPISDPNVSLYHFYYQGGNYYRTDGTQITAPLPFAPSDLTLVYDGTTAGSSGVSDLRVDGSGKPLIAYGVINSPNYALRLARWSGSAWLNSVVASGTDPGPFLTSTAIDPLDPDSLITAEPVAGVYELIRYRFGSRTAITTGSPGAGIFYPAAVYNAASGLRVVAPYGSYTTYLVNALGITGIGS